MLRALSPASLPPLRDRFSVAMNALLRRELRNAAGELRKSAGAAVSATPQEADVINVTRWVDMIAFTCPCPHAVACSVVHGQFTVLLRRSIDEHAAVARGSAASTPQRGVSSFSGSYRDSGLMPHVAYQCASCA